LEKGRKKVKGHTNLQSETAPNKKMFISKKLQGRIQNAASYKKRKDRSWGKELARTAARRREFTAYFKITPSVSNF